MATVVLTAVGGAIGGPIGGIIGAYVGGKIDAEIFKAPAREGPRIKELDVQTSSYGSNIPAIFGAMRVAGSVIWSTDLIENRSKKSGGKGKPKTAEYTYSISMAVALSSKPLLRIGRIWADGNLLRGAAGDFKTPTMFRFYNGHEDQTADPYIASAEGATNAPAFRGIAYAMFEDLQLADYGNRIPSLTFEVFERDTDVHVNTVFDYASQGLIKGNSTQQIMGYALEGGNGRAGLSPLLSALPIIISTSDDDLQMQDIWHASGDITNITPAARLDKSRYDTPEQYRLNQGTVPQSLSLRHYDPAREYQISVQRSSRADTGRQSAQMDLAATLSADNARRLADVQLLQIQRGNTGWNGHAIIGPDVLHAGDWVRTNNDGGVWQITEIEHLGLVSRIAARHAITANPATATIAEPGRSVKGDDLVIGPTKLVLMDLPAMTAADPQKVQIAVAAAGNNTAWRSAALFIDEGGYSNAIGTTASTGIMGVSANSLSWYSPALVDNTNALLVNLYHDNMLLPAGSGNPLSSDAPMIWISGEVIRYGLAEYLGAGQYRLSRLLRGCHGTQDKIDGHQTGEDVVLLEADTLRILDDITVTTGQQLTVEASGVGDDVPISVQITVAALSLKPLAPVHGKAWVYTSGDVQLEWTRRARVDYGWQDGVDQPMTEDIEQYAVEIWQGGTQLSVLTTNTNSLNIPGNNPALSAAGQKEFHIRQIGKFAQSDPLIIRW
jgi:hypothetical protein